MATRIGGRARRTPRRARGQFFNNAADFISNLASLAFENKSFIALKIWI